MRSALESKVGFKIPVAHPLLSWLVSHSANVLSWYSRAATVGLLINVFEAGRLMGNFFCSACVVGAGVAVMGQCMVPIGFQLVFN